MTSTALFVLVSLLFLTVGVYEARADGAAADGDLLHVISIKHEIDFGRGVDIRLEADVTGPLTSIIEVRAVFTATRDGSVSSYAYPTFEVTPGASGQFGVGKLAANFTIDTGIRAYYPPGTEFDVFFELTGRDGSVTATETTRILYLDPAKDWQLLSAPDIPLDFLYYGFPEVTAARLAERVSATWRPIAMALGIDPGANDFDRRFRAVIYPNVREFNSVFPPTSAASSDGVFFGGFAMEHFGVFVLGGPSPGSAVHELTHLLVNTKVNSPLSPGVPSWLHEGLAQYFEAGSSSPYTSQLGRAAAAGQLLTLRNRNNVPARGSEIGLYYTQVGSFVGELIEMRGAEPMAETLRLINEGSFAAEAIETAYGIPLWQLENEWRVRLGASELPPPPESTDRTEPTARSGATPVTSTVPGSIGGNNATPQATATPTEDEIAAAGVTVGDAPADEAESGFDWTGPLIGMAAAGAVFFVWSVRVNRRRFRTRRR
ncbi:MAG: peptidase MA family metallohydrolase [Chloroflexi bacterium]|nr:peptidase MA family metallohydrolase [Chloroflexota bacterium]